MREKPKQQNYRSMALKIRRILESKDWKETFGAEIEKRIRNLPIQAHDTSDVIQKSQALGGYYELRQLLAWTEFIFQEAEREKKEIRQRHEAAREELNETRG